MILHFEIIVVMQSVQTGMYICKLNDLLTWNIEKSEINFSFENIFLLPDVNRNNDIVLFYYPPTGDPLSFFFFCKKRWKSSFIIHRRDI